MKIYRQISAFYLLLPVVIAAIGSCRPSETMYPVVPHIEYLYHEYSQDDDNFYLNIHLSFTDGDGDIGLAEEEETPPFDTGLYAANIHVSYFEKVNGEFRRIAQVDSRNDTSYIDYSGRLPVLTPPGRSKAIKGEIVYKIKDKRPDREIIPGVPDPNRGEVVKFEVWVNDRALNKSNVVEIPEFVLESL